MKIQIDFREKDILLNFNKENEINEILIESVSLPVGDILIEKENDIYAIERKTVADLSASIKDGRFRDQKQRLIESIKDPERIVYIIEGKWSSKLLPKNTIESAMLNLQFVHQYKVIRTNSVEETINIIKLLYKKIEKGDFTNKEIKEEAKLIAKKDRQKIKLFENQLCMINGVSMKIAEKIKEKYKNMFCLIENYNQKELLSEKELLLVDIEITEKRKIGKALSKKIYNSLINQEEEDVK